MRKGPCGRDATRARREEQCAAIVEIIQARFANPATADWLVLGDLNDFTHVDGTPDTNHGLGPLGIGTFCIDLVARVPPLDRWTHYFDDEDAYRQLDHILASPAVAQKSASAVPQIVRLGVPHRATRYQCPRSPRVGYDRPKASDHCPVVCEVTF